MLSYTVENQKTLGKKTKDRMKKPGYGKEQNKNKMVFPDNWVKRFDLGHFAIGGDSALVYIQVAIRNSTFHFIRVKSFPQIL